MHREKMINWKLIELIKSKSLPGTNKNQAPHHVIKRHIYIEDRGGGVTHLLRIGARCIFSN